MKNTGFSLVELLVVIAIMAILAGVAVPVYSHYTNEAKEKVDENYLAEVFHAAEIEAARIGDTVTDISFVDGKLVIDLAVGDDKTSGGSPENMADTVLEIAGSHDWQSTKYKTVANQIWPAA